MADQFPEKLGKYKIIAEVGRGGFAAVYKAVDTTLDRTVALKVLAPHLLWDPTFVQRFQREAKVAANLDHPNIVTIYEVSQIEGVYIIAMQFLEGRTLSQLLEAEGALPISRVQAIVEQIASALDYAHARDFVHRDIKPSNIIVADDGRATLTDIGLVKAGEGTQLTASGVVFGTPEYMSPEQAEGKTLDARSDIYSLGVVLYEMLAGRAPFVADTTPAVMYKHVHEPPPLEELPSDLAPGVVAVVEKALAKERDARYQSAGEMGRALKQAIEARVEVTPVPPQAEVPAPPLVVEKPAEEKVVYPPVEPAAVVKEEPRPPTVAPVPKAAPKKALRMGALVAGGLVLLCCMVGVIIRVIWPSPTPTPEVVEKVVKEVKVEVEKLIVLNANLGREPPTLDPALATDTTSVLCDKQLFLGLTAFYQDTPDVVLELATEWSVSSDDVTWTFKMRDDVKWVNYNPETKEVKELGMVNAHDVVYGFKRTLDPVTASNYAYVLYIIEGAEAANTGDGSLDDVGVKAVDDYTLEFTLEQPAGYFPAIAAMWVARPQPEAVIEEFGEKWTEPGNIVTNGPYMLESWEHEASMVMVKNPKYYDADNVQIERIELAMVQEDFTEMAMYENNELDATGGDLGWGPPLEDTDRIKADPVLSKDLKITPRLCTYYYGFQHQATL